VHNNCPTVRAVDDERELEAVIPAVLAWLPEAAGAFFDYLFGNHSAAHVMLRDWLVRDSSELSIKRALLLYHGDTAIGGFIALSGRELRACKRADTLALANAVSTGDRAALVHRLRCAASVRQPVAEDVFYLSKLGIDGRHRGRGFGKALALEFFDVGRRRGFRRFELDVEPENTAAICLYESVGMTAVAESSSCDGVLRLRRMTRDDLSAS
jgi:ribosomal protein S18 acetylase RimI-like enzyme